MISRLDLVAIVASILLVFKGLQTAVRTRGFMRYGTWYKGREEIWGFSWI
jgi:hypothetical protein